MGINIVMEDVLTIVVYILLFLLAFKAGQISVYVKLSKEQVEKIVLPDSKTTIIPSRPVITVEEINGIYYAYDGNDFLAQGSNPSELGLVIAQRFPNKYRSAQIQVRA